MRFTVLLAFLFLHHVVFSQEFTSGLFPEIALSLPIESNTEYKAKVESFHPMYDERAWDVSYSNTDLQQFIDYSLNPYWSVAGGYQFRLAKKDRQHHRTIQQVSYVRRMNSRLAHRIRTDQTFMKDEPTEWRLRYRLSLENPLQGLQLEKGERYFIASNEVIGSTEGSEQDIENRLDAGIGAYFKNNHKAETGVSYRTSGYLLSEVRHQLWFKLSYFFN